MVYYYYKYYPGIIAVVGTVAYTTTSSAQGDRRSLAVLPLSARLAAPRIESESQGLRQVQESVLGHAPTRASASNPGRTGWVETGPGHLSWDGVSDVHGVRRRPQSAYGTRALPKRTCRSRRKED